MGDAELDPLVDHDPRQIGAYRIVGRLGAGGMGQVFLGEDPQGRQAAVKVVHPGLAHDPQFRQRFRREVEVSRLVRGPWVAAVLDADAEAAAPWLATEFVPGPSLTDVLDRYNRLEPAAVRRLGHGLASALAGIHAGGLVHRDVKPSNVLMADDGPRLIDFGISRAVDATRMTGTGAVIGTPGYMSPEQVDGHEAGPASDIFSLGVLLAYAAGGRHPFGEATPVVLMLRISRDEPDLGDVPEILRLSLSACLAKRAEDRPSAADLAREFEPVRKTVVATAVGSSVPHTVELPSASGASVDPPRRRIGRRALIVGGGLVAAGGITGGIFAAFRPSLPLRSARVIWQTDVDNGPFAVDDFSLYTYGSSKVSALNRRSGGVRWTVPAVPRANGYAPSIFVLGTRVIAVGGQELAAFDIRTGERAWSRPLESAVTSNVVAAGAVVVVSTPDALVGLDESYGAEVWRTEVPFELVSHGVHAHESSCVVSRADSSRVEALDASTGRVRWSRDVGGYSSCAALSAGPGPMYCAVAGALRALDPATGRILWERSDTVRALRAGVSGVVVRTEDSRLLVLDDTTGAERWSVDVDATFEDEPTGSAQLVFGDGIICLPARTEMRVLDFATGKQLWSVGSGSFGGVAAYDNVGYVNHGSSVLAITAS